MCGDQLDDFSFLPSIDYAMEMILEDCHVSSGAGNPGDFFEDGSDGAVTIEISQVIESLTCDIAAKFACDGVHQDCRVTLMFQDFGARVVRIRIEAIIGDKPLPAVSENSCLECIVSVKNKLAFDVVSHISQILG